MQAQVEVITLAYAKQLLEQNPRNRRVNRTIVARYAADMKAGLWVNNGQGIVISPEGELLDGQHRMHAIVEAQTSVAMMVVRGVPRDVFATLDSGKPRSAGDVLSIEGCRHPTVAAGVARIAFNYASGTHFNFQASKAALVDFIHRHPYAFETSETVQGPHKFPKIPLAAVLFLANERRTLDDEAKQFSEGVMFGEGLWKGDARLTLRDWIINQRQVGRGTVRSFAIFAATARAWNAYAQGRELLVIKGVEFPTRRNLPIFGYQQDTYADLADLSPGTKQPKRKRLDEEVRSRILALRETGKTYGEIAQELKVSRGAVSGHVHRTLALSNEAA